MGRKRMKLSAVEVNTSHLDNNARRRYLLDGGGLYLMITRLASSDPDDKRRKVADTITKSWSFRYRSRVTGRTVELGLGSYPDVSLAAARDKAEVFRKQLSEGIDPRTAKNEQQIARKIESAKALTFDEAAARCIKDKKAGWKNEKHGQQWENTLATYVSPIIGSLPVAAIDLPLIRKVLDPIWTTKNETASRVRQRIEAVLAWATVSGYRNGENPARWKNHLDHLLATPTKVKKVENHPALAYQRLGDFMVALRGQDGLAPLALELAILTAARSDEVVAATPGEFDLQKCLWTIPAERMKAKKEHTVPLSPRAVEIVQQALQHNESGWLFPGQKEGKGFSNGAMLKAVKLMHAKSLKEGGKGWCDPDGRRIVPHGFRSTFRDWAGECSNFPREVIENALAHQLKDKAEAAYARGTQFVKRKALMDAWATYCSKPSIKAAENVIPIRKKA